MTVKEQLVAWLDANLIPEWRKALKMFSVQTDILLGAAATIWVSLDEGQRAALAELVGIPPAYILVAGALVKIYLRLKDQPKLHAEAPDEPQP